MRIFTLIYGFSLPLWKKSDLMWRGTGRDGPDSGDFSEQRLLTVSQSWKSIQLSTKVRINLTFRGSSGVAGRGRSSGLNYPPDRNGFMQSVDSAVIICRRRLHKNHWNSHQSVLVQGQNSVFIGQGFSAAEKYEFYTFCTFYHHCRWRILPVIQKQIFSVFKAFPKSHFNINWYTMYKIWLRY